MKEADALRLAFQSISEITIIAHLADTALAQTLPDDLSVAGFGVLFTGLALMLRSAVYGMARMQVDGQLAQWGVSQRSARRELQATLDALIDGFRRRPANPPE